MAEFYFTAAIANGYEYRNTPDNYRHFLMELPVNKEELTYIFNEIGLDLSSKPGEYIFETADPQFQKYTRRALRKGQALFR